MLPASHRLTSGDDFRRTVRGGRKAGSRTLVLHLLADGTAVPARAGLVVSRAVGGSVVRNRVKRQLRHLLRDRVGSLPDGSLLVVRATPAAASAGSHRLGSDLDRGLSRVAGPRDAAPSGAEAADRAGAPS